MVLLGKLDVDLIGVYPIVGPWPFCIESRDVLENDCGGEPRLFFERSLKNDAQDDWALGGVSGRFEIGSGFAVDDSGLLRSII